MSEQKPISAEERADYLVLTCDEVLKMLDFVGGDRDRFRELWEYMVTLPQPSRSYTIHSEQKDGAR